MPFVVHTASQVTSGAMVSDRRLFVAADEKTVVEDGDPRSRFLLCTAGGTIAADQVRALGLELVDGKVTQPASDAPKAKEKTDDKQQEKREDKSRTPSDDKGKAGR